MQDLKQLTKETLVAGSLAALLSGAALAWFGRRNANAPAAPVNASSHWLWGDEALRADRPDLKHTLIGHLVHHGASLFWGALHSAAWGHRPEAKRPLPALAGGAAGAAVACFVDYQLTPKRLTPGFEHRLSTSQMAVVYGLFAVGLAVGSMACRPRATDAPEEEDEAGTPASNVTPMARRRIRPAPSNPQDPASAPSA